MNMNYVSLPGLKVGDYEYPGEDNAFALLKKIPLLDQITSAFLKLSIQTGLLPATQGDCYRITETTCPEVYGLYRTALQRLDIQEEYPLYAKSDFEFNAYAVGGDPFVVVHSSMLNNFQTDELLFVLGHELGHVKSGHVIYANMAENLRALIAQVPVIGQEAALGLYFALHNWYRMQECTADRAGAIAAGSIDAGIRGLGRLMGTDERLPLIHFTERDILQQNDAFEEANEDFITKVICLAQIAESSHPWSVTRVKRLREWEESGGFEAVIRKYC